jgi:2-polyprenyl-3-methyl-5-hydroxy-6-metoxy-1,4-benzoquinol methylase
MEPHRSPNFFCERWVKWGLIAGETPMVKILVSDIPRVPWKREAGATMFRELQEINSRPEPFQYYTAEELWTDDHTSMKMLGYHLNEDIDVSSRNRPFINRSVDWIVSQFGIDDTTRVADFGRGPGLYTIPFAEKGARVTGIDFSERSIQYAEHIAAQKGLAINFVKQNYLDFETDDRFDLITMIFCDFCALSPAQRETLLSRFRTLLKPGGRVLLDVHSLKTFDSKEEVATYEPNQLDGFWSAEDYYGFLNTFKYPREKVSLDKYTIVEKTGTRVVYNWLQHFSRDSLTEELVSSGLEVSEFYADVAGTPFDPESPDMAVVAKRM